MGFPLSSHRSGGVLQCRGVFQALVFGEVLPGHFFLFSGDGRVPGIHNIRFSETVPRTRIGTGNTAIIVPL